jgi:hypothetical protein
MKRRQEPVLLSIMGSAVLVAGVLIALGLATEGRRPPATATRADSAAPPRATAPPVVVPLPPSVATAPLLAAGDFSLARRASGGKAERRGRGRHRVARPRGLPTDLTLNPF